MSAAAWSEETFRRLGVRETHRPGLQARGEEADGAADRRLLL